MNDLFRVHHITHLYFIFFNCEWFEIRALVGKLSIERDFIPSRWRRQILKLEALMLIFNDCANYKTQKHKYGPCICAIHLIHTNKRYSHQSVRKCKQMQHNTHTYSKTFRSKYQVAMLARCVPKQIARVVMFFMLSLFRVAICSLTADFSYHESVLSGSNISRTVESNIRSVCLPFLSNSDSVIFSL